ncbi:DUF3987 domain-containing protein [Bythopirellula polymerisocia]|uniref:DUF3987 domain-containing protein n=1 Tax=Bythopirellula polymerisocia TaxID=2528003 RepID=A0A5C6CV31_9BACT|nr:YfjI family protein [Bythopirellula polymerisocia]TWU28412.1 hypothetical protein Pla144_17000 [Bythopirellula polymerisocia]
MTPVERVLETLPDAKQGGKGWSACCPAHEDRRASLSINEGEDGRALIKCHAGCTVEEICDAMGLTVLDLMTTANNWPASDVYVNGNHNKSKKSAIPLTPKQADKTFATPQQAVAYLERQHGPRSALWTYQEAEGEPAGLVVRWDLTDGKKDIRPVSRQGDGWRIGGMSEPRPLYRLPDLAVASRVYICEGEKAADAIRALGLVATTSPHGCESATKADWGPLAGKEIIILPDNDPPGYKYADSVAAQLATLTPPSTVKVLELPDLPDHGDAADWVEARRDVDADELRRQLEALANEAESIQVERPTACIERYQPFPTKALPEPVRGFVIAGAKAIGCYASYLALPMLSVMASLIGNTRCIQLMRGWSAQAIIWTAIVGESGTSKTPAYKLVMKPLRELQRNALEEYMEAMKRYEVELAQYEKEFLQWKRDKKANTLPPEKPEAPRAIRYFVSDTTVEALSPLLLENPRGLLLACDELAGWIGSFDRYSGGKGGTDASHWLSLHNGESIVVDRKTGTPRTIYIPQASVSITGGIQPSILHRALGSEHRESGLAARLLLSCPPRKQKRWTEADIDPEEEAKIARLIERLLDLKPTTDDAGRPCPQVVKLTPEAKAAWIEYYNQHAEEQNDLSGDLSAAWSKLEEYAARLALVVHCARWAADDPTLESPDAVDLASMKAGIELAQWFKAETRRVYALLSESDNDRDQRRLIEWIERRGESVTPTEVRRGNRRFQTTPDAEAALAELVKAGVGIWEPTPPGRRGQPTRRFVLSTVSTVYGNTLKPDENGNTVDVDSVDTPKTQSDADWGEL